MIAGEIPLANENLLNLDVAQVRGCNDEYGLERKFTSTCRAESQLDFAIRKRKNDEFVRV
jgi:hypothetical protein